MSLFKNIFAGNGSAPNTESFWKNMSTLEDLRSAISESNDKRVIIFKHSTRCYISQTVLKMFEEEVRNSDNDYSYYFLNLIAYRDISNAIADEFRIRHESPQVIVVENGKVIHHASHQSISLKSF